MNLGWCDACLNVKNLKSSRAFYEELGLKVAEGNWEDKYFVMYNGAIRIGLYEGHFEGFMVNFRGGDVLANAKLLEEKGLTLQGDLNVEQYESNAATFLDPDGNIIFLNTHPDELSAEYQKKIGVL